MLTGRMVSAVFLPVMLVMSMFSTACVTDMPELEPVAAAMVEKLEPTTEKDALEAVAWCMAACFEKHTTMCPAMDTLAERQDCYDACAVMVLPYQCYDEYTELQMCRLSYLPEFVCRNGEAVPANSYCNSLGFSYTICLALHH